MNTFKKTSVCAVVVTYNRKELLIECLNSLIKQSVELDAIVLIDNASTDGTSNLLNQKGLLYHSKIRYHLMSHNLGGAGGFSEGVKIAYEQGANWIWVMDDDAEPLPDALEKLSHFFESENTVALCPIVKDANLKLEENQHHRGWFTEYKNDRVVLGVKESDIYDKKSIKIEHSSFVGLCFSSDAVTKIGYPRGDFFIHYDDLEFCIRLNSIGNLLLVSDSVIMHKEAAKSGLFIKRKFLGRISNRINYEKLWLLYFGYRNRTWLIKNKKIQGGLLKIYFLHLKKMIGVIAYDDHKLERVCFWNEAFCDGLRGVFDNSKPKNLLNKSNVSQP